MKYLTAKIGALCLIALLIGFFIGFAVGVRQTIDWTVDIGLKIMNKYGYNYTAYSELIKSMIYKYRGQIGGLIENAPLYVDTGNQT